jgi:alpha-D-ribose 1-methylphosphonate 5-triphosphate synthase subunit PhnL
MIPIPLNPFRPTRWEHQRDGYQLIWLTKTASLLAGEKPVYLRGSRGSGKTTLLKSICWEDVARNTSLKMQKGFAEFSHIGIYIRFPDHLASSPEF